MYYDWYIKSVRYIPNLETLIFLLSIAENSPNIREEELDRLSYVRMPIVDSEYSGNTIMFSALSYSLEKPVYFSIADDYYQNLPIALLDSDGYYYFPEN